MNLKNVNKKTNRIYVFLGVLIVIATCSLFYLHLGRDVHQTIDTQQGELRVSYTEMSKQSAALLEERLKNSIHYLECAAKMAERTDFYMDDQLIIDALKVRDGESLIFEAIYPVDLQGNAYQVEGTAAFNIADQEYFQKAVKGDQCITIKQIDGKDDVFVAVPVKRYQQIVGVVVGKFNLEAFKKLASVHYLNGQDDTYIVNSGGSVLFNAEEKVADKKLQDIRADLTKETSVNAQEMENFFMLLKDRKPAQLSYAQLETGKQMTVYATPIDVNDWYLLSVTPQDVPSMPQKTPYLAMGSILLYLLVMLCGVMLIRKNCKQLALSELSFSTLKDLTEDITFEWNQGQQKLSCSKNFQKKFGYSLVDTKSIENLINHNIIFKDDQRLFLEFFQSIGEEDKSLTGEFRIKKANGQYIWCRVSIVSIFDGNTLMKVMGLIADIDYKKNKQ